MTTCLLRSPAKTGSIRFNVAQMPHLVAALCRDDTVEYRGNERPSDIMRKPVEDDITRAGPPRDRIRTYY